ncbi:hypothetical protein BROUX41_003775 [Berkeleyomyces rouxiae]|uniref:uncharacterized protein n=1 Tax=Berkeleyomyces rouxiae TaxID=2035830 RepID=UPI003B786DD8
MRPGTLVAPGLLAHGIYAHLLDSVAEAETSPASEYCTTPACQRIATELKQNLAHNYQKFNPCTDFEEMVCGGWREVHDIRDDQRRIDTMSLIKDRVAEITREIVEGPLPADIDPESQDAQNFYKMKTAYDACMNTEAIFKLGIEPLKAKLEMLDSATTIEDAIITLLENGMDGLVRVTPMLDDANPNVLTIGVSGPQDLGLPSREHFKQDKLVKKYCAVVAQVLGSFDDTIDVSAANKLVTFERSLALSMPPSADSQNIKLLYNPMSLEKAASLAPSIDLEGIIKALAPKDVSIRDVVVLHPGYLTSLEYTLEDTSLLLLKSYFKWRMIQGYAAFFEHDVFRPLLELQIDIAGITPETKLDRQDTCIRKLGSNLDGILGRFFIEKAFSPAAKAFGEEMVDNMREVFTTKLRAVEWMDKRTTKNAIEKVQNMNQKIGYPTESPDITNPDDLFEFYELVQVNSDTFFENEVSIRKMTFTMQWEALAEPFEDKEWQAGCHAANAYYSPAGNEMMLPAGLMQFPIFDPDVPAYVSYGAYGSVVGHELSHAFDDTGRYYDPKGRYRDWWDQATERQFDEKTQCFVDQFSAFVHPNSPPKARYHVDGKFTLNENIADSGGLSVSYDAWKKFDAKTGATGGQKLPGLDFFTREQLFFVSFGSLWCSKTRGYASRLSSDPHAPPWARIKGSVANNRAFLQAFDCPVKEPVCEMW